MKRVLLKLLKGISLAIILVAVVIFSIYSIAWYTFTKRAEVYLDALWQDKSFIIVGEKPDFHNYPFVPKAKFSGSIEQENGFLFSTPELTFTGFPAQLQIQTLEAPSGFKLSSRYLEQDINLNYAFLQFIPPSNIPYSDRKEDIAAWQKDDNKFYVRQIVLKAGNIYAHGNGTISLDNNLQLAADINARVVGMDVLLDEMAKEKGEKTIAIARSFFNMLSKIDEKTGERYFETTLRIQDRAIFSGPMRISGLPELKWR